MTPTVPQLAVTASQMGPKKRKVNKALTENPPPTPKTTTTVPSVVIAPAAASAAQATMAATEDSTNPVEAEDKLETWAQVARKGAKKVVSACTAKKAIFVNGRKGAGENPHIRPN